MRKRVQVSSLNVLRVSNYAEGKNTSTPLDFVLCVFVVLGLLFLIIISFVGAADHLRNSSNTQRWGVWDYQFDKPLERVKVVSETDQVEEPPPKAKAARPSMRRHKKEKAEVAVNGDIEITVEKADLPHAVELSLAIIARSGHDERIRHLIGAIKDQEVKPGDLPTRIGADVSDRNFLDEPISVGRLRLNGKCSVPCGTCGRGGACDVRKCSFTMENVGVSHSRQSISGNTKLSSLVPVPYISWHDFGLMEITPEQSDWLSSKTQTSLACAFVSNCHFPKRNKMIRDLQKYLGVDSYGGCENNKNEKELVSGTRNENKLNLMRSYKFSLAFENSETIDYVTEKFWGSLLAGAVPVVIGAPNTKFWAPDTGPYPYQSKAMIFAGDFNFNAEKLAEYLLYLDSNDTAYLEYLQWKTKGYSDDFKAAVDVTSVHSTCRACIVAGDWLRQEEGISVWELPDESYLQDGADAEKGKIVYLRQRGFFKYVEVILREPSLSSLVEAALSFVPIVEFNKWKNNDQAGMKVGVARVYAIYNKQHKTFVHTDAAVAEVPSGVELEVIFV